MSRSRPGVRGRGGILASNCLGEAEREPLARPLRRLRKRVGGMDGMDGRDYFPPAPKWMGGIAPIFIWGYPPHPSILSVTSLLTIFSCPLTSG